jgi:hypothetical protein
LSKRFGVNYGIRAFMFIRERVEPRGRCIFFNRLNCYVEYVKY